MTTDVIGDSFRHWHSHWNWDWDSAMKNEPAAKSRLPGISDAEWLVMQAVWDRHPIASNEVAERLCPGRNWSPRTVKTLLNRLVRKGALRFQADGKRYLYSPAVSRQECVGAESRSFLHRVFAGAAGPMLVHFVQHARLTEDDIRALRAVLDQKGQEDQKDQKDQKEEGRR